MKPIKIGIDMDEVLVSLISSQFDYHNKTRGTNLKKEDIKSNFIEHATGYTLDEAIKFVREFVKTEDYMELSPIEGVKDTLSHFKDNHNHELVIITARSENVRDTTESWINRHLPNLFSEIHLIGSTTNIQEVIRTKGESAKTLGVSLFIEDSLSNAKNIVSYGIPVILLDKPWNQEENLSPLIIRVNNWNEIVEQVNKMQF